MSCKNWTSKVSRDVITLTWRTLGRTRTRPSVSLFPSIFNRKHRYLCTLWEHTQGAFTYEILMPIYSVCSTCVWLNILFSRSICPIFFKSSDYYLFSLKSSCSLFCGLSCRLKVYANWNRFLVDISNVCHAIRTFTVTFESLTNAFPIFAITSTHDEKNSVCIIGAWFFSVYAMSDCELLKF